MKQNLICQALVSVELDCSHVHVKDGCCDENGRFQIRFHSMREPHVNARMHDHQRFFIVLSTDLLKCCVCEEKHEVWEVSMTVAKFI